MWKENNRALFVQCLGSLERDPRVLQMQKYQQHTPGVSCYDHCLCVAYFSFTICRMLGLDYTAAARGGMLHDLYLSHWEENPAGAWVRWRTHPQVALDNARCYGLNDKEADIIVKHMWPLTLTLPRYRESYVVSLADKLAAVLEKTHLTRPLGIRRNLALLAA